MARLEGIRTQACSQHHGRALHTELLFHFSGLDMISSFLKRLLFGGLTLSASLVHSDPDKASTYRALMEHAQTQAHVRACVSTPPPPDQQAAWKNHYGWPLQGAISSTQLEALLNLPASSSTYLSPNFSLDCSDAQMTRALLFTLKLDGRWHITVYM